MDESLEAKRLREIIRSGETLDVEFKGEERVPLNDRELALHTAGCAVQQSTFIGTFRTFPVCLLGLNLLLS